VTALAHDDLVKWYWVPTIGDISAPTVAEQTAGTLIPGITNYSTPNSESEVDTSDIDSLYDTSVVGTTKSGPIEITMKRDDTDETDTWDLFSTVRQAGYLMKAINGVPVASDKVEVYPVQVGTRRPESYSRNTAQKFMVNFYVTSEPDLDATLTA